MTDRDNVIHVKTYAFAIRVVNAYRFYAILNKNMSYPSKCYAVEQLLVR